MAIVLYLAAILALSWLVGCGVAITLRTLLPVSLFEIRAVRLILPAVGYIFGCVVWWAGTFVFKLHNATSLLLAASPVGIGLLLAARQRFSRRLLVPLLPAKCDLPALVVLVSVAVMASWPYVVSGMGNYVFFNDTDWFNRVTPSILLGQEVTEVVRKDVALSDQDYASNRAYVGDFPLQLSNIMLTEQVMRVSANDAAVMRSIIELILTALGTYWLSRYLFRFTLWPAVITGFFGVIAQFYFHTFLDGHIGSVIYTSGAPYFFGLCAWALSQNRYRATVIISALIAIYLWKAYPPVIALLILPLLASKALVLYRALEHALVKFLGRILKTSLPVLAFRLVLILAGIIVAVPTYQFVRSIFYANRAAALVMGYDPMYIVFDKQVLEWFYGLRITQGFGYGVLDPGTDVHTYNLFATLLAIALTITVPIACWRLFKNRLTSFLAVFLVILPPLAIVFASLYPFTYVVYKVLYVHYFLWVIGVVCGFRYLIQRAQLSGKRAVVFALFGVAGLSAAANVIGSAMNSSISLNRSRLVDPADARSLARRVQSAGINNITVQADDNNFTRGLIYYTFRSAGLSVVRAGYGGEALGRPIVTPQFAVFAPISPRNVAVRSAGGKYVLSFTPNTLVEVGGYQSPEISKGVVFRWLHSSLDYEAFSFDRELSNVARYLSSLPQQPLVCNDLFDSGYFLQVNTLMAKYKIRRSDNPLECRYFITASHHLQSTVANFKIARKQSKLSSLLIGGIGAGTGPRRVVKQSLANRGNSRVVWSGDLFDVEEVPLLGRQLTPLPKAYVRGLLSSVRRLNLNNKILNGIPGPEYERYYFEQYLGAAALGMANARNATAALILIPDFEYRRDAAKTDFRNSILWKSGELGTGYNIYLVTIQLANRLNALRSRDQFWALAEHQPMRTLLFPSDGGAFLTIRTFRSDRDLRLLFETGPSLLKTTSIMRVMRADGDAEPLFYKVEAPSQVITIPVKYFAKRGEGSTMIAFEPMPQLEQRVMPSDDRVLTYLLEDCELVNPRAPLYTEKLKRIAQTSVSATASENDILDPSAHPTLSLGAGWYQREIEGGSVFRWMSDHADLVFENGNTPSKRIVINGIVGPSAGPRRIPIIASVNGIQVFAEDVAHSDGRVNLVLDPNSSVFKKALRPGQNVIRLTTTEAGVPSPDTRVLNFRVFRVGFEGFGAGVAQQATAQR